MSRGLLGRLVVLGTAALVACGSDFTSGDGGGGAAPGGSGGTSTSSGSGGSTTSSGTGGGSDCPDDTLPVPPIPDQWSGPTKIVGASSPGSLPGCPFEGLTLHDDLQFEGATCGCTCGNLGCQATIGHYNNYACSGTPVATDPLTNPCNPFNAGGSSAKWWSTPVCPANPVKELPEVGWANHLRACAIFESGSENASCAPAPTDPFQSALCIVREGGSHSCPPGYEDRLELFYDVNDTRDCTTGCECLPGTAQCGAAVHTHSASNCIQGSVMDTWAEDNCLTSLTFPAVSYVALSSDGACAPTEVQATGTVTPTNPFTVCCTPQ